MEEVKCKAIKRPQERREIVKEGENKDNRHSVQYKGEAKIAKRTAQSKTQIRMAYRSKGEEGGKVKGN